MIVKAVNLKNTSHTTEIKADRMVSEADIYYMSGYSMDAENTLDEPENVVIKTDKAIAENGVINYEIPAESVCVFRIR